MSQSISKLTRLNPSESRCAGVIGAVRSGLCTVLGKGESFDSKISGCGGSQRALSTPIDRKLVDPKGRKENGHFGARSREHLGWME